MLQWPLYGFSFFLFCFLLHGEKKKSYERIGGKERKFSTSTDHSLQAAGHASAVFDKQGSSILGTWTLDAVQLKLQLPSLRIFWAVTGDSPSLNLLPIPFLYFVVGCCYCPSPSCPELTQGKAKCREVLPAVLTRLLYQPLNLILTNLPAMSNGD